MADFGPIPQTIFESEHYLALGDDLARLFLELNVVCSYWGRFPASGQTLARLIGRSAVTLTDVLGRLAEDGWVFLYETDDLKTGQRVLVGEIVGYDEDCPAARRSNRGDGPRKVRARWRSIEDESSKLIRGCQSSYYNPTKAALHTPRKQLSQVVATVSKRDQKDLSRAREGGAHPGQGFQPLQIQTRRRLVKFTHFSPDRKFVSDEHRHYAETLFHDLHSRMKNKPKPQDIMLTQREELEKYITQTAKAYPSAFLEKVPEWVARKTWPSTRPLREFDEEVQMRQIVLARATV